MSVNLSSPVCQSHCLDTLYCFASYHPPSCLERRVVSEIPSLLYSVAIKATFHANDKNLTIEVQHWKALFACRSMEVTDYINPCPNFIAYFTVNSATP